LNRPTAALSLNADLTCRASRRPARQAAGICAGSGAAARVAPDTSSAAPTCSGDPARAAGAPSAGEDAT